MNFTTKLLIVEKECYLKLNVTQVFEGNMMLNSSKYFESRTVYARALQVVM